MRTAKDIQKRIVDGLLEMREGYIQDLEDALLAYAEVYGDYEGQDGEILKTINFARIMVESRAK